jgi:hypothetical protein
MAKILIKMFQKMKKDKKFFYKQEKHKNIIFFNERDVLKHDENALKKSLKELN